MIRYDIIKERKGNNERSSQNPPLPLLPHLPLPNNTLSPAIINTTRPPYILASKTTTSPTTHNSTLTRCLSFTPTPSNAISTRTPTPSGTTPVRADLAIFVSVVVDVWMVVMVVFADVSVVVWDAWEGGRGVYFCYRAGC